ncbi:MAG: helix-turn-helix domain-containing protein, partial [Sphingomonadales bacterium]
MPNCACFRAARSSGCWPSMPGWSGCCSSGCQAVAFGPVTFDLPLTRGEMAEVLGLSIETVSRQLTRLKDRGAITLMGARGITIRDRTLLKE